jgi:hypothetical protein
MILLAVILVPASDFFCFRFLSLLVRLFQRRKRESLRRCLVLILGLLVHESLLRIRSLAQRQTRMNNEPTPTS